MTVSLLFAGGAKEQKTTTGTATASATGKHGEPPFLAQLVADGKLPPIDERLPSNPLVLTKQRNDAPDGILNYQDGNYGGTLRMVNQHPFNTPVLSFMLIEQMRMGDMNARRADSSRATRFTGEPKSSVGWNRNA